MQELTTAKELAEAVARSAEEPILLFKHSTRCPISASAYRRMQDYADGDSTAPRPPVYLVKVVESRPVSNAITDDFRISHESPQLILLHNGQPTWHTSHHNITPANIEKALGESA